MVVGMNTTHYSGIIPHESLFLFLVLNSVCGSKRLFDNNLFLFARKSMIFSTNLTKCEYSMIMITIIIDFD